MHCCADPKRPRYSTCFEFASRKLSKYSLDKEFRVHPSRGQGAKGQRGQAIYLVPWPLDPLIPLPLKLASEASQVQYCASGEQVEIALAHERRVIWTVRCRRRLHGMIVGYAIRYCRGPFAGTISLTVRVRRLVQASQRIFCRGSRLSAHGPVFRLIR